MEKFNPLQYFYQLQDVADDAPAWIKAKMSCERRSPTFWGVYEQVRVWVCIGACVRARVHVTNASVAVANGNLTVLIGAQFIYLCSGQRDGKWHLDGILVFTNTFQSSSSHQDIGPWDVKLFPWRKREDGSEDGPGVLRDAKDLPYRIWLMHVKATASGTLTGMCVCARARI